MRPTIAKDDPAEFWTPERCFVKEFWNSSSDDALSIARIRVPAQGVTQWHSLRNTNERYLILSGRGRMEVGESLADHVTAGNIVVIPSDLPQRITNTEEQDLVFLALCTPRFIPSAYQNLEK
jgi:mannose-6-phosphate isomerase-like protein (cupin superfamily)